MKKVAISINTSWNVFNFRLGLCKELQKLGYEIIVIAPKDEYTQKLINIGFTHFDITIHNKGTNPIQDAILTYKYFLLYRKIQPDIALHFTIKPDIYASLAAGILQIPIITNITGLGSLFVHDRFSTKIAKLLYKIALNLPKKVFFQNMEDKEAFIYHKLVSRERTGLLPGSGIDPELFKPQRKTAYTDSTFIFLMIARLVKDKGIMEYIEAAQILHVKYPHVEFQVLGALYEENPTAVSTEELQSWIDNGIINYLGHSDHVSDLIKECDCIVLPSYREGMSRILLEAASMEKPIVTTKVPGCMEIVDDTKNGFLCHVADAKDLTAKMEKMLNLNYDTIKAMGRYSREKIMADFDEHIIIEKYLAVIQEVLPDAQ
ncbi:MAG: glycosyltransferase family 4 protein [Campylobacterota bacterium]|nr:glycosyltransferase family 4 protein [Campylobacterota bacterium]